MLVLTTAATERHNLNDTDRHSLRESFFISTLIKWSVSTEQCTNDIQKF